jgi:hypothetical protein
MLAPEVQRLRILSRPKEQQKNQAEKENKNKIKFMQWKLRKTSYFKKNRMPRR